jgi:hypothetical protein
MSINLLIEEDIKALQVVSPEFSGGNRIPKKYTSDGENINPPLVIDKIPEDTKSLVLIVDDPDAPIRPWNHWIVYNISPKKKIKEKSIPGVEGTSDFRFHNYSGPCPPSGIHHYHFKIYALDTLLDLGKGATKLEVEKKMSPHILAFGELVGIYKRD